MFIFYFETVYYVLDMNNFSYYYVLENFLYYRF